MPATEGDQLGPSESFRPKANGPDRAESIDRMRSATMTLLDLILDAVEPDVDALSHVDGLPALRIRHAGAESLVLVLPAKGGVANLLEMLDELAELRTRRTR